MVILAPHYTLMTKTLTIGFILTIYFPLTFGQTGPEAVYLKKSSSLSIDIRDENLWIVEQNLSEKKFFRNFEKHSRESVYYSDFDPVTSLDAVTMIPARSGYKKAKVTTIETEDIFQSGIFYGGYKRRNFVYPSLVEGAIGTLEYTKQINDVHLLTPFYFDEDVPVESAEFSVAFPARVNIRYKLFGANPTESP
jgi:hypothetical protein